MSSYLEAYGEAEEGRVRRNRALKAAAIALAGVLALGLILYGIFKNYSEERRAKTFLSLLGERNYAGAYELWGCTAAHPCPNYRFEKFMEDWGPKSAHPDPGAGRIGLSESCGTGVLLRVDYAGAEPVALWVERDTKAIGYAPFPECPGRHLRVGAWLRSLFKR